VIVGWFATLDYSLYRQPGSNAFQGVSTHTLHWQFLTYSLMVTSAQGFSSIKPVSLEAQDLAAFQWWIGAFWTVVILRVVLARAAQLVFPRFGSGGQDVHAGSAASPGVVGLAARQHAAPLYRKSKRRPAGTTVQGRGTRYSRSRVSRLRPRDNRSVLAQGARGVTVMSVCSTMLRGENVVD
jgi:hypothetical protein